MFLAWNEIQKNKLRFVLIIGVLMLVAYLVFFLSGLANGLASLNREAVDKWEATAVVLTEESDKSLVSSSMSIEDAGQMAVDEIAVLGQISAIASNENQKANVSIFGIKEDEFIMPEVVEGEAFAGGNEVIASDALKEDGFKLGDELKLSSTEETLKIVGFTEDARFNAAPVLYGDLPTFQRVKFGEAAEVNEDQINGVVVRTDDIAAITKDEELDAIEVETFIESLPGYTEQSLTLNFMIYFLFVISSVIVAIFLYVLTVQKISMFGVMKAQGVPSGYLARSVIAQTFILAAIGVAVGFALTLATGIFLPSAVPVAFDIPTMLVYGAVLIAVAIAGAVFSVWTIVKIDPLKAIGG
ncbi:ABC transporter permease [Planococcus shenhongbingii]|uniref:Putative hemin transport system permease protein HrtB n=1 Tax=Planococcus shenhongbingii TaxID=3058398 RepID=A0ABT8NFE5_9BACL|nr:MULTISPECIES: ABC transporter permease [unclassified Planococcus (in: firmicutes)]MDN7246628.1 ABC transporter permease [Planococcus sp. N017]WKA59011.1 ABC transporter permease [Planococcus sp. N016]